jgi:SAM-dependent methyltransferase
VSAQRLHWETLYRSKAADQVGWFQPCAAASLQMIADCGVPDPGIIDVGAGASVLVDELLDAGYRDLTVLDLADTALSVSRTRLGARGDAVTWLAADVLKADLPAARFDVWHDRAVFHFLTDAVDRACYVEQVWRSVKPGGHVIVAAFSPNGPTRCAGLDVVRYAPDALGAALGARFQPQRHEIQIHRTPAGEEQEYVYCCCRRL